MGIGLKDIMNNDKSENLVKDKSKSILKILIIIAIIVFFLIVIVFVNIVNNENIKKQAEYVKSVANDMLNIQNVVKAKGVDYRLNPGTTELIGISLAEGSFLYDNDDKLVYDLENPYYILDGDKKVYYQYNYYYVFPTDASVLSQTLTNNDQHYIVNYLTGEVVNVAGITYRGKLYHTIDSIVWLKNYINGVEQEPFQNVVYINTANDMDLIRSNPAGTYKLSSDIDMKEYSAGNWNPIEIFTGTFEGRGYTIYNLTISDSSKKYCGLFAQSSGTLSEIKLRDVSISGGELTGALAGYCSGAVKNSSVVGGSVASQYSSVGGLIGAFENGYIQNCYTYISVSGQDSVGGLLGSLYGGSLYQSYSDSNVVGIESAGGFIGSIRPNAITNLEECCSHGTVVATKNAGGLIGNIEMISASTLTIKNAYSSGAIQASDDVAGGSIGNLYATNNASLVLEAIYTASDTPSNSTNRGGFLGKANVLTGMNMSVIQCFWEKDSLIDIDVPDVGTANKILVFEPKTPSEMKVTATFGEWDLSIWKIDAGVSRPSLKWEIVPLKK